MPVTAMEQLQHQLAVVRELSEYLDGRGVKPYRCPDAASPAEPKVSFAHLRQMVEDLELDLIHGRERAFERNLGFIQGVLWGYGCKTLLELRTMERTAGAE